MGGSGQKEGIQRHLSRDVCVAEDRCPSNVASSTRVHWLGRSPQLISCNCIEVQRYSCSSCILVEANLRVGELQTNNQEAVDRWSLSGLAA